MSGDRRAERSSEEQSTRRLIRNGYSLGASTISSSAFGVIFWLIAARRYDEADVGIDASLIAALTFLVNLAHLNITTGFNRFLPTAGHRAKHMVLWGYLVAVGLSVFAAIVFILGANVWTPELAETVQQPVFAAFFVIATALTAVFVLQDFVLTGLGQAKIVLIENTGYGLVKAALVAAFVVVFPQHGVFVSWGFALVVAVIPISVLLPRLIARRPQTPMEHIGPRDMRRYVLPDYFASLVFMATVSLVPVIILEIDGPDASAYAYLAWTIAYSLYLLSRVMGMSLVTEAATNPGQLVEFVGTAMARCLQIVVPLALILAIGAKYWLLPFGSEYSENGAALLALLALAAIPNVVTNTYLSVVRVQRRMKAVFVTMSVMSVAVLVLTLALVSRFGIIGLGWAWLITQTVTAAVLLAVELRPLWMRRVPVHHVARVAQHPLSVSLRRGPSLDRARTIVAREHATRQFEIVGRLAHDATQDILALRKPTTDEQAVLRIGHDRDAEDTLRRSAEALIRLETCGAFADAPTVVPRLLACSFEPGDAWTMETRCPGIDSRRLLRAGGDPSTLLTAVATRASALYATTGRPAEPSDALVEHLVTQPVAAMVRSLGQDRLRGSSDEQRLRELEAELTEVLTGDPVTVSYVHGDLWPGNVLCDSSVTAVTGLIDWDSAHMAMPAVDVMQLVLTTRCLERRRQLGAIVTELLRNPEWRPHEQALLESVPGARELSTASILKFAWLHHLYTNLRKSSRYGSSSFWVAHNMHPVLDAI